MVIEKKATHFRLTSKERKQLLFWGSILVVAMLGFIYLITPDGNAAQAIPAKEQTEANRK